MLMHTCVHVSTFHLNNYVTCFKCFKTDSCNLFSEMFQTDGTGVYMTSLSHEYAHAASTFNFSKQDLWHLSLASIDSIFAPERVKMKLKERWQAAWPGDS